MKKEFLLCLGLIFCFLAQINAAITYSSNNITITGTETGNTLRTFIAANPLSGTVTNTDIVFKANLTINGTFSDANAVYHFPSTWVYAPQNGAVVTFTDVMIHYTGTQKSYGYNNAYTANFTRVTYLQGVTSGRSDFFNNGNYTFNMTDCNFVSYGANDYLHFQTPQTMNNITIVAANNGLNFEPGANNAGETEIINNLKLRGINSLVGGLNANGDFKAYNMDWNNTTWTVLQRNVDFLFVNPIKPTGWVGYAGASYADVNRVKEYYTHDVTVVDNFGNAISAMPVKLYNNAQSVFDYQLTTNAQGAIAQREVLKIDNSVSLNYNRGTFTLILARYDYEYYTTSRTLSAPTKDIILAITDKNVTKTSAAASAIAGIAINHTSGSEQITISSAVTLCDLYDFIKYDKINNNITKPSINTMAVTVDATANTLQMGNYKIVFTSTGVLKPCSKFEKITSSKTSTIPTPDTNLEVGLTDATNTYKLIRLKDVISGTATITDQNTNAVLRTVTNYTGDLNLVVQSNSNNVKALVTRIGYTNWATAMDLTTGNVFSFSVTQAPGAATPATLSNQTAELYLLRKILQKNQAIQSELGDSAIPNITLNAINQPSCTEASEEKQTEMIDLLRKILAKTTAIRENK